MSRSWQNVCTFLSLMRHCACYLLSPCSARSCSTLCANTISILCTVRVYSNLFVRAAIRKSLSEFHILQLLSAPPWNGMQVPTTLMAAVDASVGIKTAVNFHEKKNKLGTYCPPLAVFLDRAFMRTLDQRNISNGAAEMLKMVCRPPLCMSMVVHTHVSVYIKGED